MTIGEVRPSSILGDRGFCWSLNINSLLPLRSIKQVHDRLTVQGGDVVGNLSAVFPVVHHEKVKVGDVVDDELVEAVGEQVLGLLV